MLHVYRRRGTSTNTAATLTIYKLAKKLQQIGPKLMAINGRGIRGKQCPGDLSVASYDVKTRAVFREVGG